MAAWARFAKSLLHLQTRGRYEEINPKRATDSGGGSSSTTS